MSVVQQRLLDKLDELKEWQAQEKKKLISKQESERMKLSKEQTKLYQILGINSTKFQKVETEVSLVSTISNEYEENDAEEILNESGKSSSDECEETPQVPLKKPQNPSNKIISPLRNLDLVTNEENPDKPIVKRPFLKRGAGLTTRFRVHPDKFKLENLPKYKYSDRVKNFLTKDNSKPSSKEIKETKVQNSNSSAPKAVMSETTQAKPKEKVTEWFKTCQASHSDIEETPRHRSEPKKMVPKAISWANLLGNNSAMESSINLSDLRMKIQEMDAAEKREIEEIDLFEMLEEKLKNSSFASDNSTIIKVLEALQDQKELDQEDSAVNLQLKPHPNDSKKKIIVESSDSESEESRNEKDHHVRFSDNIVVVNDSQTSDDNAEIQENLGKDDDTITDDAATILSTDLEAIELSKTSTPNDKQNFLEFKKKLLGKKGKKSPLTFTQQDEIKEKGTLLKTRLEELEKEIENFREQNSVLIKMKQELELEKIQFDNDREEMLEKIKDDRIKAEIFLHDERVKLEEEKKRCEKMVREARNPNRKEREETAKLKATVEELKDELKAREAKHGSSQARFRAQIRQFEKDNQSQKLELEVLRKEIRKLEMENVRLRRETNSKMLQEINKNIAKLAPVSTDSEDKKKKVPAKPAPSRRSEPIIQKSTKKRFTSEPNLTSKSEDEDIEEQEVSSDDEVETFKKPIRLSQNKENVPNQTKVIDSMKREIDNPDGSKDIWYPNGNLKKISPDGMLIRMLYYNKDIKETNMHEGTIKYYYADKNTWQTTYLDGLEILEYPDGQMEHRYKDGTIELHYPNGSIRITNSKTTEDVREEWRYPDGSNIKIFTNDTKIVQFPNGQREIHTQNHSRREYPDGTVKIVYKDGSQETRYSDGRIRIKDKDGKLISDTMGQK